VDWDDFVARADAERELQRSVTALAHPARRFVVGLLRYDGTYATDLATSVAANFGMSVTRASEHMNILARAKLVDVVPEGPWRHYSLHLGGGAALSQWLEDTELNGRGEGRGFG